MGYSGNYSIQDSSFKWEEYTFKGANSIKIVLRPFWKGYTLKRPLFRRGLKSRKANRKSQKLFPLEQKDGKSQTGSHKSCFPWPKGRKNLPNASIHHNSLVVRNRLNDPFRCSSEEVSKSHSSRLDFFSVESIDIFSYFSMKTYVVGTHSKHLAEALWLSTHNICFRGKSEKKKHYLDTHPNLELWSPLRRWYQCKLTPDDIMCRTQSTLPGQFLR